MSTQEEIESLTTMIRVLTREAPSDQALANRYAQWLKQMLQQLRLAVTRLDDATP